MRGSHSKVFFRISFLGILQYKVACLRGCECIAKRLWCRCCPVDIAEFLRANCFMEHLVAVSGLSVFPEFWYFLFHYLTFDINIIYFLWCKQKSSNQFFLYKLMIFFSSQKVWNFWKWTIDPFLSISPKVRFIMISIIVGLLVFLYLQNRFSESAILNDKRHLDVIFVNVVFYFDGSICYCIFRLNRYHFFVHVNIFGLVTLV